MKWDGQAYAEDIKYGLNLLLTDEDKEKAQSMQQKEYTEYFKSRHEKDMECFSRFAGAGSIVLKCDSNCVEFDFQRTLNNLGDRKITLTWSMAARHIRAWEFEKKSEEIREKIHQTFGMQHSDEEDDTMSFGNAAKTSKFNISSLVGETIKNSSNIIEIPVDKLKPFNNGRQPFRMYTSDKMNELMESIKTSGLLQPILVWDKGDEDYEILAGHNRVKACKELGMETVKSIPLKGLTEEQARLVVTDTNLCQRTELLPSERTAAYKMQRDALKALGVRNAIEAVSEQYGESRKTISRYLSLGNLHSELMESVDEGKIQINAGAVIATISEKGQEELADYLSRNPKTKLTEAAATKLKSALENNDDRAAEIISKAFEKKETNKPFTVKLQADIEDILDISKDMVGEFLYFALQHREWQEEFSNLQYRSEEEDMEDLEEDTEDFDEEADFEEEM